MKDISKNDSCFCEDKSLLSDKARLEYFLEKLMIVRKFEENVFELFKKGLVHGTTHLGIGEEATGVGTTAALTHDDYIFTTHRGHGPAIGKGLDVSLMMAEILAKTTGTCKGRGGSMHIADIDHGVLAANGILGANAPLACGAAFTSKTKRLNRVSVAFFGDGAANQGAIHESMNLASAWKLPVIFCLTNNRYAMSTPLENAVNETDFAKRAVGYGIHVIECDGNDVINVYESAKKARDYAINNGPVLLIEHTYRTSGHSKSDVNLYRTASEIEFWQARNPITRYTKFLHDNKLLTDAEVESIDEKTTKLIDDAIDFAINSPSPDAGDVLNDIYA